MESIEEYIKIQLGFFSRSLATCKQPVSFFSSIQYEVCPGIYSKYF